MKKVYFLIAIVLTLIGCGEPPLPKFVFVPGESFKESITVSASMTTVKVGEPVVLHAARDISGYVQVSYSSLPKDHYTAWWRSEPPSHEPEVADNVRWVATPKEGAKFNLQFRSDHTREVTFSNPGKYQLIGYTGRGGKEIAGNTIEITVNP